MAKSAKEKSNPGLAARLYMGAVWLVMGTSVLTMLAWWTQWAAVVQVQSGWAPMQFNTALAFVLCALTLWFEASEYRRALVVTSAIGVSLVLVTLIQYPLGISLGIDTVLAKPFVTDATSHPGRMSPNTGLSFLALLLSAGARLGRRRYMVALAGLLSAMVVAIAVATLVIYLAGLPANVGFRNLTAMAVTTALGMLLLGASSLLNTLSAHRRLFRGAANSWLPVVVGLSVALSTVVLWGALVGDRERELIEEADLVGQVLENELTSRLDLAMIRLSEPKRPDSANLEPRGLFFEPPSELTPRLLPEDPRAAPSSAAALTLHCSDQELWMGVRNGSSIRWGRIATDPPEAATLHVLFATGISVTFGGACLIGVRGDEKFAALSASQRTFDWEGHEISLRVWPERLGHSTATSIVLVLGLLSALAASLLVAELQLSTARGRELHAWIEGAPVGLALVADTGRIARVNGRALEIFDAPLSEVQGSLVESWVPTEQREHHVRQRRTFTEEGSAPRLMGPEGNVTLRRRDGRLVPVEVGIGSLVIDGRDFVLCAMTDIEQRVLTERALQKSSIELALANEELKRFSSVLSHDLRAPIRGMATLASFVQEDDGEALSETSQEHLSMLRHRGQLALRMVDGLLDLARIGSASEDVEEVHLAILATEAFELASPPQGFSLQIEDQVGPLRTSRAALFQVVFNLMTNSIRHHDQESGVIRIESRRVGTHAEIRVIDDGPGIPAEYRAEVFTLFRQLNKKEAGDGVGLGLSLVKKRIEAQGGNIQLQDAPGRGLVVVFRWPLGLESEEVASERERES